MWLYSIWLHQFVDISESFIKLFRVASAEMGKSHDCPIANEATQKVMNTIYHSAKKNPHTLDPASTAHTILTTWPKCNNDGAHPTCVLSTILVLSLTQGGGGGVGLQAGTHTGGGYSMCTQGSIHATRWGLGVVYDHIFPNTPNWQFEIYVWM